MGSLGGLSLAWLGAPRSTDRGDEPPACVPSGPLHLAPHFPFLAPYDYDDDAPRASEGITIKRS